MRRTAIALFAAHFFCGLALARPEPAGGVLQFTVDDAWGRDTVQFKTTAPMEDIIGTTNQVTGFLKADPKNLTGPGTAAHLEVNLASFKTGIEMRNGAVAKALGAAKNPAAVFNVERIKSASVNGLEPNAPVDIVAEGTFELKGVRKKIEVPARITYVPRGGPFSQMRPGNFLRLTAQFDFKLADYDVDRNGPVLPLQVGDTAHVIVAVLATDASAEEMKEYRDRAIKYMGKARQ
jgi:polyisoprenoid-binding protein YceI